MAIELITGLPGHGKTLYTLARYREIAEKQGRPVFHNGIKDLKLPWQVWPVEDWQNLPAGAVFIIDEAQFSLPVRGRGEPPEWVAKFATHRHLGLDIVLVTQNPMLVDAFVRRLVDRHWHVVRKFGTQFATLHEFANGVKENVAQSRKGSITHEWRYPKDVFELYTSAELHTVKRRIPARVWVLLAMPVVVFGLLATAYYRLRPGGVSSAAYIAQEAASAAGGNGRSSYAGRSSGLQGGAMRSAKLDADEFVAQYVPRVEGLDYTAPVYDEVTRPAVAPYPAACVQSGDRCKCYSQQGTALAVAKELCAQIVAGGFFVSWVQPVVQAVRLSTVQPGQAVGDLAGFNTSPHTSRLVEAAASAPGALPERQVVRSAAR